MLSFLANLFGSFLLGLLTPLTALCVLPLFPGFLAYLASQTRRGEKSMAAMGVVVASGVLLFMLLLGLVFTTLLESALTPVVAVVSPIAMVILVVISILLLLDVDIGKYLPRFESPESRNPYLSSLLFGLFFGAVVLPCNPGFIAVMFAKSLASGALGYAANMLHFLLFGFGMAAPLLLFSLVSLKYSRVIITFLTKYKSPINRIAGGLMLVIALYYLFFVFRVQELF